MAMFYDSGSQAITTYAYLFSVHFDRNRRHGSYTITQV